MIDFNTAPRRHHYSPEERKLCRQVEAEFDLGSSTPPRTVIDLNYARRQDEPHTNEIDADVLGDRLNAVVVQFHQLAVRWQGADQKARCKDSNIQGVPGWSLSIALTGPDRGQWFDHSTQEKGNLIGLYRQHTGFTANIDFPLSLKEIAKYFFHDPIDLERQRRRTPLQRIAEVSAKHGTKPIEEIEQLGAPVRAFKYFDITRTIITIVRRFEPDGTRKSKTFRPHCYKLVDGVEKWTAGMPDPRPLYRLPDIAYRVVLQFTCDRRSAGWASQWNCAADASDRRRRSHEFRSFRVGNRDIRQLVGVDLHHASEPSG